MGKTPNGMISVIVPTYKSPEALDLCLRSAIDGQQNTNQIIVVVDGFYELNKDVLEKYKLHIDILTLETNVGLCRGTNLGVYNATHDKILIVNDDNVFPQGWDNTLLDHYRPGTVVAPNQIEPYPSMFHQFHIKDLGRDPQTFDLSVFWKYESTINPKQQLDGCGSTLPIFMSKLDYLSVGGWDENYPLGMVADWDFFLKCSLSGLDFIRLYNCNFYHFVSLSTNNTKPDEQSRLEAETQGHQYARYKWGTDIKHNPEDNSKYL